MVNFCAGFRAPVRKQNNFPDKSTICFQRGSYSDREKAWAHAAHIDFSIFWHMQQESKICYQKYLVVPVIFASTTFPLPLSL